MWTHHFYSPLYALLGCFQFGQIINTAAMKPPAQHLPPCGGSPGVDFRSTPTLPGVPHGVQCQLLFPVNVFLLIPANARHLAAFHDSPSRLVVPL